MSVKTLYPHTLSQSTGSNIQSFNNLGNLKTDNSTYAKTNQIASKSGTRKKPASITAKKFKANLPAGSKINNVTVEYAADYEGNISIGKPTINILKITGDNKKGKALTKTMTKTSVSWSGDHYVSNINHDDFGVTISFPANTKADTGYVKLKYIRIIIDYTTPNFSVSGQHVSGTYLKEEHLVKLTLSNVNKTKQGSNVNIQLPSGLGYIRQDSGNGNVFQNPGTPVSLVWETDIGSKSSASVVLRVYPQNSQTYTINWSETGSGHSGSFSITAIASPHLEHPDVPMNTPEIVSDDEAAPTSSVTPTNVIQVDINEEFSLDLKFDDYSGSSVRLYSYFSDYTFDISDAVEDGGHTQSNPAWTCGRTDKILAYTVVYSQWAFRSVNSWDSYNQIWSYSNMDLNRLSGMENLFKINASGYYTLLLYSSDGNTLLKKILISVRPATVSNLMYSLFPLSIEEMNRLGNDIVYTVQSYMKLITSEPFARDWGSNFKIGVFNNRIESNIEALSSFGSFSNDSVTATLDIPSSVDSYSVSSDYDIDITENTDNIIFSKSDDYSNVTVKIDFLDSEENIIVTGEYYINFDDETVIILSNDYDPTDYSNLTNDTIANNAKYWSNLLPQVNEFVNNTVDFSYDENYPVYIILSGDYSQGNPFDNSIKFTEPCIVESDAYNGKEPNGNYPLPILNMIDDAAEEPSVIQLSSFEESTHVILYNPPLSENYGTNDTFAIRGIEITADIDFADDLILFAKLKVRHDNQYVIGNRSVIINNNDNTLKIGGKFDTWGLNISELINLEQLELELGVNNILKETDASILLKNIQLTIYSNEIIHQGVGVIVEDEDVAWYGMDVTNFEIPFGRNSDTKYLNVEGTDTNVAYRQVIRGKTIKLYFDVEGCDLNETTEQVQQLAKLFTNNRDGITPIPKRIRFSHIPDKFFYYILEDTFDTDVRISDYKGSIELTIPDGTAFDIEDTVTNINGYVDGIASVNPIIAVTHITDTQLVISELVNTPNQVFRINKENLTDTNIAFGVNDTIVINCITRTCSLIKADETETIDISEAVDFNSDWFKIQGEFEFKPENCIIQTVTYNTRS